MKAYGIEIEWKGPFSLNKVINEMDDWGQSPTWNGKDYGLYQIYGRHILCGENTLLYVGKTTERTFSRRFKEHREWLLEDQYEKDIKIYLGRIYNPKKHSEKDKWKSWKEDIEDAEKVLVYKYSPNYNSRELARIPKLHHQKVQLVNRREKGRLKYKDIHPKDYLE
jgi:hypothetical protein